MQEDINPNLFVNVKSDLYYGICECRKRGLVQSTKWLAEINHSYKDEFNFKIKVDTKPNDICEDEQDAYYLAMSYYEVREYDRAAYFTRECNSPIPKFLHLYSTYMAKEKKRLDNMTNNSTLNNSNQYRDLSELLSILKTEHSKRTLDGYLLYLYGIILSKMDLNELAITIFLESIHKEPTMWGSWFELSSLITNKEKLMSLKFPEHWIMYFFLAQINVKLLQNDEGIKQFEELQLMGFKNCTFITSQIAISYHNKRDVEQAISIFQQIQEVDPYRLENLDIYSNLLFVKEMKTQMAFLAHKVVEINKYAPETCCVIGNYYSIRSDHQKAVLYFQRALKLNPRYLAAWTLMGHEFMEMKNTNAAIQSYRQAIEVNRRDFRAWYGLGQAYEILKMYYYSLYYYKTAQNLRPYDSRMLVALGETFEKLNKPKNALKCFEKACNVGDIEGVALLKLATIYESMKETEKAIATYEEFCNEERPIVDKTSLYKAYLTLGTYYEAKDCFERAQMFAYKCLEFEETKTEAQSLLALIANKREKVKEKPTTEVETSIDCEEVAMEEDSIIMHSDSMVPDNLFQPIGADLENVQQEDAPNDPDLPSNQNSMEMSTYFDNL